MINRPKSHIWGLVLSVVLLAIVVFSITFPIGVSAQTSRQVRIGVYDNPPKIYQDEHGKVSGFYADILDYIASKENWELIYVPGTFDEGLNRLSLGEIDAMVDVAFSQERLQQFDFTNVTILSSWGVIFVREDSNINSFQDLDQKKIAILKSSVYLSEPGSFGTYINAFNLHINFVELDEYDQVLSLLSKGEVDAAVVSRISGQYAARKYPNLKATDIVFSPSELRFALTKNDPENAYLINKLDYWADKLRDGQDGVYDKSLTSHGISALSTEVEVIPNWVLIVGVIAFVLILSSWFLVVFLRRSRHVALMSAKESEVKYSSIVKAMDEGVVFQQKDGKIVAANPAAAKILGVSVKELLGETSDTRTAEFNIIHEDGTPFPGNTHPAMTTLKTGVPQKDVVMGMLRPDKSMVWISINSQPLKSNPNSEPYGVVTTFRDITEQKKLDEHKKEVDLLKNKFIRIVSHQLRTPLSVIRWSLESVIKDLPKGITKEQNEFLNMAYAEDIKIINRIADLLEIMSIEEKKVELDLKETDINQLFKSICAKKAKTSSAKKLTIKVIEPSKKLPKINIDEKKISSVVERFLDNAIAYTAQDGKVEVKFYAKGNNVRFEVTDTGIGIDEAESHSVFQKFFRGLQAEKMEPNSFGLSLYLAKYYIKAHHGKVGFSSKPKNGSVFWFELPIS